MIDGLLNKNGKKLIQSITFITILGGGGIMANGFGLKTLSLLQLIN
jgi:hypothetical protein